MRFRQSFFHNPAVVLTLFALLAGPGVSAPVYAAMEQKVSSGQEQAQTDGGGIVPSGMQALDDSEMAGIDGTGIAIALEDFRFEMGAESFAEQVGLDPGTGTNFQRGDLRWYGLTMSEAGGGASNRTHWTGGACGSGHGTGGFGLGCPRAGQVQYFAAHDNPYIVRAFEYSGLDVGGTEVDKTVLDVLAPTSQDDYRWAFWGELEVGKDGSTNDALLKSQTMIEGSAQGSKLRLFQFDEDGTDTLGLFYENHLQGAFRFSVAQQAGSTSDALGEPVAFDTDEGLHFVNVDVFMPFGQLHYQALTLDSVGDPGDFNPDGNFVLQLTRLPGTPAVYEEHYALMTGDTLGYATANAALDGSLDSTSNYFNTHGHVRYGDWAPDAPDNCIGDNEPTCSSNWAGRTWQGMFFSAPAGAEITTWARTMTEVDMEGDIGDGNRPGGTGVYTTPETVTNQTINIGDSRIEGMNIQHFRLESLGVE